MLIEAIELAAQNEALKAPVAAPVGDTAAAFEAQLRRLETSGGHAQC